MAGTAKLYITYPPAPAAETPTSPAVPDVFPLFVPADGSAYSLVVCGHATRKNNNKILKPTLTPKDGDATTAIPGIVRKEPKNWAVLFPIPSVDITKAYYTIQITDKQNSPAATVKVNFVVAVDRTPEERVRLAPGAGATVDGHGFSVNFANPDGYACAADITQSGGPTYRGTLISEGPPTAVFSFQDIPAGGNYTIIGYVYSMPPSSTSSGDITVIYPMGPP